MRISDWSSDVCSSDLTGPACRKARSPHKVRPCPPTARQLRQAPHGWPDRHSHRVQAPPPPASLRGHSSAPPRHLPPDRGRSEEHTSALQSLMRISYAVFCLKTKKTNVPTNDQHHIHKHQHKSLLMDNEKK